MLASFAYGYYICFFGSFFFSTRSQQLFDQGPEIREAPHLQENVHDEQQPQQWQ